MKNRSLFVKIMLPLALLIVIAMALTTRKTINLVDDSISKEFELKTKSEATDIENIIKNNYKLLFFMYGDNQNSYNKNLSTTKEEIINQIKNNQSKDDFLTILENKKVLYSNIKIDMENIKNILSNKSDIIQINNSRYKYITFSFKPFNWKIILFFNKSNYFHLINNNKYNIILYVSIILIMIITLISTLLYIFIKKPLLKFGKYFEHISKGNYDRLDEDFGSIEFNKFASEISNMSLSLKQREELIKNKMQLVQEERDFIKELLDSQKNIILVNNSKEILQVNKSFFDFFDEYNTLDEFKNKHGCVCDYFIKEDGYIYTFEDKNWIEYIVGNESIEHKVKIKHNDITSIFLVDVNRVANGEKFIVSFTNITKSEEYKRSLENANKLLLEYKKAVDASAIVSKTDKHGKITYVNSQFIDISGYSKEELIGKNHNIVRDHDTPKETFKEMWETILNKKIWKGQIKNRKKNGDYYVVHATISPIVDASGKIIEFIALRFDITDIYKAREKALKAEAAKGQFLANMSHEIRTPLNAIIGFTKLLLREKNLPEKAGKYLSTIDGSAETLLSIINDILDISKIESSDITLENSKFEPLKHFEQTMELFRAKAYEKSINYKVFVDPRLPTCIIGDKHKLKQVVSNLLGNAIKFTPQNGTIEAKVELKNTTDKRCQIEFSIQDSGMGISKDKQKSIFEAFSQADNSITRKFGGTGLGLTISDKIVKSMNSKIKIESDEGEGSRFYFETEFEICEMTNEKKDNFNDLDILIYSRWTDKDKDVNFFVKYLKSMARVEIVDNIQLPLKHKYDMAFICDDELSLLKNDDHIVPICIVTDKDEVKEKYKNRYYILDIPFNASSIFDIFLELKHTHSAKISVKNGIEEADETGSFKGKILVAEDHPINQQLLSALLDERGEINYEMVENGQLALEKLEKTEYDLVFLDIHMPVRDGIETIKIIKESGISTPVVALTANAVSGDKEKFLSLGFDGYIAKPIQEERLDEVLKKYLTNITSEEKHTKQPQTQEHKEVSKFDIESVSKELHIPLKVFQKIVDNFFKTVDSDLSKLSSSIKSLDFDEIYKDAHKIKGGAANLRLTKIANICKNIEKESKENDNSFDFLKEFEKLQKEVSDINTQG